MFLPPATKFGQGYIFTGVCDSVHGGGVPAPGCLLWGVPASGGTFSQGGSAPEGVCSLGVPGGDPRDGHCCGQYASYRNAFLLSLSLPPVFEFMATARMMMGNGFLVLSPNIIKVSLPGYCPLPFRQWPLRGKT